LPPDGGRLFFVNQFLDRRKVCTRIVVPLLAITVLHQPIQPAEVSLSLSLSLSLSRRLARSSLSSGLSRSLVAKLNSPGRAEQRGCAHTLLAPAAQDEISFPPAPILCPVIVHVKQPETCICPVGSQRRLPFALLVTALSFPTLRDTIARMPDGEHRRWSRGKIPKVASQ